MSKTNKLLKDFKEHEWDSKRKFTFAQREIINNLLGLYASIYPEGIGQTYDPDRQAIMQAFVGYVETKEWEAYKGSREYEADHY